MNILIVLSSFLITINALQIKCEFDDDHFNGWEKRYSCKTVKYLTEGNAKIVEKIDGAQKNTSYTNFNVTQFFAKGIKIEQFPEGLAMHFGFLEVIRIVSCDMTILYKSSLENLTNIKYLDLLGNRLENLDSDTFENTPKLIEVWLNNNRLQFIGAQLLNPLKSLRVINLGGNTCIGSNSRHSDEELERLKIEIRLKCSDVSMYDLVRKLMRMEENIEVLTRKIDKFHDDFIESKKMKKFEK
jgi:Leucine rich repeat